MYITRQFSLLSTLKIFIPFFGMSLLLEQKQHATDRARDYIQEII
jgi:hypothetical protein